MTCEIDNTLYCSLKEKVWCEKTSATTGYTVDDGCMLLGCDGDDSTTIVYPLTGDAEHPNKDRPVDGVRKNPPTWGMTTLCELAKGDCDPDKLPKIGTNGNWFICDKDTGKPSRGAKGDKGD